MKRAISTISWPYSSYASASRLRPAAELADRPAVVVDPPQVVAGGGRPAGSERGERAVERQDVEAVPRQLELADDLGAEQRHDVREDREPEAREELLGDRRAAEDVAPLEDERLHPGAGEIRGADQAVVAAADDDRVVALGQPDASLALSSCVGLVQAPLYPRCGHGRRTFHPMRPSRRTLPPMSDRGDAPRAEPPISRPTSSSDCRTGASGRRSTSRRCVPPSAGPLPGARRGPGGGHRGARRDAEPGLVGSAGPALLRVRRRRRRAGGAGGRLADERLGPERRACTRCRRPRPSSRRSRRPGSSTSSGCRRARASGSRPAPRWRTSRRSRRRGIGSWSGSAGTSRRTG